MTWLRRFRPALYVLGVVLVIGSLVGGRALTAGSGQGGEPKTANPAQAPARTGGPIVLGTVDSEPSPVSYLLPPVLPSGTVETVYVKGGQQVKAEDPLYKFDTSLQERELAKAKAAVEVAQSKVGEAEEGVKRHAMQIKRMEEVVAAAKTKEDMQAALFRLVKSNLESFYKTQAIPEAEWPSKLLTEDKLYTVQVAYASAKIDVKMREIELTELKAANPQVMVKQAEAGVRLAEEEMKKAKEVVDLCTIRAKTAGTIERVMIGQGSTLGVGTREPALWLVPAGPRIVRAEIEAEFAHRVGAELEGKEVTVYDNSDPRLTYKGVVRTVGGTFLPKRSAGGNLLGNDTTVLEAVVVVADPAPPGKPPLRVNQRVRVSLGQ